MKGRAEPRRFAKQRGKEVIEAAAAANPQLNKNSPLKKNTTRPHEDKIGFVSDIDEESGCDTDTSSAPEGVCNIKEIGKESPCQSMFALISTLMWKPQGQCPLLDS